MKKEKGVDGKKKNRPPSAGQTKLGIIMDIQKILQSMEFRLGIILVIFLVAVMLATQFWGSFALGQPGASLFLHSFDKKVSSLSLFCVEAGIVPNDFKTPQTFTIHYFTDQKALGSSQLTVQKNSETIKNCFPATNLEAGDNLVNVSTGSNTVFFHIEKTDNIVPDHSTVSILALNETAVQVKLEGFNRASYSPLQIFVNEKLDHELYPEKDGTYTEAIQLQGGENSVKVKFGNSVDQDSIALPISNDYYWIGFVLIALTLLILNVFMFSRIENFFERSAMVLGSFFVLLILNGFVLNLVHAITIYTFAAVLIFELIVIGWIYRKNLKFREWKDFGKNLTFFDVVLVLFMIFITMLFHLYSQVPFTFWSNFYERQSAMVAGNFGLPAIDPLSYFGRGFSFNPGYFFIDAGLSWLTGLKGVPLFGIILVFANLFLIFSVMHFVNSLNLSKLHGSILLMLLWTNSVIFSFLSLTPRHLISFSMMILALSLLIRKDVKWSGIFLGIASFIQAPIFLAFAFSYPFLTKKVEWKTFAKGLVWGGIVFIAFYWQNFLDYGLLTQERSTSWGYLIQLPLYVILGGFGALTFFFLCFVVYEAIQSAKNKKISLEPYQLKLFFGSILALVIQAFVTSRWEIVTTLIASVFLITIIDIKQENQKLLAQTFFALFVIVMFISTSIAGAVVVPDNMLMATSFLKENSSTNANILVDPLFGHTVTYFSDRKVLADLWVEYADGKKLDDEFVFLKTKDEAILDKYSIDYIFTQGDLINEFLVNNLPLSEPLEFKKHDKIFTNQLISIHKT